MSTGPGSVNNNVFMNTVVEMYASTYGHLVVEGESSWVCRGKLPCLCFDLQGISCTHGRVIVHVLMFLDEHDPSFDCQHFYYDLFAARFPRGLSMGQNLKGLVLKSPLPMFSKGRFKIKWLNSQHCLNSMSVL